MPAIIELVSMNVPLGSLGLGCDLMKCCYHKKDESLVSNLMTQLWFVESRRRQGNVHEPWHRRPSS
jgi:hypothetical protein